MKLVTTQATWTACMIGFRYETNCQEYRIFLYSFSTTSSVVLKKTFRNYYNL